MTPHGRVLRVTPRSPGPDPGRRSPYEGKLGREQGNFRLSRSQGQLVAYVYWYTNVHRIPPSENEIAEFLGGRSPSAHVMMVRRGCRGVLTRRPGEPRSLKVLLPREAIPDLE